MKNLFKPLGLGMVSACLILSTFIPNIASVKATNKSNFTEDSINVVYQSDELSKFHVTNEYESYSIIVDNINNQFVVNNQIYTFDNFNLAVKEQTEDGSPTILNYLSNYSSSYSLIDYDELYEVITEPVVHENRLTTPSLEISPYCTLCGLDPYSAPTTGYSSIGYTISIKNFDATVGLILSMSGTMCSLLAGALGISIGAATKIMANLAGQGVSWGASLAGGRTIRQYYHNRCPKAVKTEALEQVLASGYTAYYSVVSVGYSYFEKPF